MAKAGRKTSLNKETFAKIKDGILDGLSLRDIAKKIKIPESTIYTWTYDNYLNLADKIEGWKRDRKLLLADERIDEILRLDVTNKDYTRAVGDMSKFVKETLDKQNYSKRSELTGKDGKDLPTPILGSYVQSDLGNKESNATNQEG